MLSYLLRHYTLLLLFSSFAIPSVVVGDDFDDAIAAKIVDLGLRGAAIAYFDKNTMQAPITRGYGQVSSARSSSAVTPDTAFMIASISKPFVASAIAILVDRGIISLDDDICDVVPENFSDEMCRNPNHPDKVVTWRMLMTHRSSMKGDLPMVKNQSGDWISPNFGPSNSAYTNNEDTGNPTCPMGGVVDFYRALLTDDPDAETSVGAGVKLQGGDDLNWYKVGDTEGIWRNYKPGARSEYSNAAYGYLTALVELATDQSFPEFCRENLFGPLGMDTTAWFLEDLPAGTLKAVPLEIRSNGGFRDIGHYCYIEYGSGSLRTTANDLARWGNSILRYGTSTLWSSYIGNEISSCQERDENNEPIQECEFGYGWILLDNSMKNRRSRHLDEKDHDDDDVAAGDHATFAPSSDTSTSETTTSSSEMTETPSDANSSNESSEESSSFSDSGTEWLEDRFENYDWTDGIMHDGSDAGVQTSMIILPKAGVYIVVLLNTNDDDGAAVFELTSSIITAPLPSYYPLDGTESALFYDSIGEFRNESSSAYLRSLSFSSLLMSAASLLLVSRLFTE